MVLEADHDLLADLTIGQLLAVIGTLAVIIGIVRKIHPVMKRLDEFMDDWFGQKARPGVEGRPGAMQRLSDQDEVLSHLRKKVEPLVDETAAGNHKEVLNKLEEISGTTHKNAAHLHNVEHLLHRHIRESRAWLVEVDKATAERDFKMPPWPDLPDDHEPK